MSLADSQIHEGESTYLYLGTSHRQSSFSTFVRPGQDTVDVRLRLSGTATNGEDYSTGDLEFSLPAARGFGALRIDAFADFVPEGTETVVIEVDSINGGRIVGDSSFVLRILNGGRDLTAELSDDIQTLKIDMHSSGELRLVPQRVELNASTTFLLYDLETQRNRRPVLKVPYSVLWQVESIEITGTDGDDRIELGAIRDRMFPSLQQIRVSAEDGND